MKTKTLIVATILSLCLFTSCREQKNNEKEVQEVVQEEVIVKQVEEQPEIDIDEKRRLDSIRQVKEHGHAH